MAGHRPQRQMPAPGNSLPPESCSPRVSAIAVTAPSFASLWKAWNTPTEKIAAHFNREQPNTIAALDSTYSPDFHDSAIVPQYPSPIVGSSRCPSNREGFKGRLRGLRAVLIYFDPLQLF